MLWSVEVAYLILSLLQKCRSPYLPDRTQCSREALEGVLSHPKFEFDFNVNFTLYVCDVVLFFIKFWEKTCIVAQILRFSVLADVSNLQATYKDLNLGDSHMGTDKCTNFYHADQVLELFLHLLWRQNSKEALIMHTFWVCWCRTTWLSLLVTALQYVKPKSSYFGPIYNPKLKELQPDITYLLLKNQQNHVAFT